MSSPRGRNDSLPAPNLQNYNQPSSTSRTTVSTGPSPKEPALITSKWTIGWQTPVFMFACYITALLIAIIHLLLFQYLDGKPSDGPNRVAPQSYISTASNILANGFGFSLRGALGIAFCQHLWHLLRVQTMKVSTIELLFAIRTNPFQLLRKATLAATPALCALAVIMWASQVATSFPPGAITVVTTLRTSYGLVQVPSFNASFMGNGSGADANAFSLIALDLPTAGDGFTTGGMQSGKSQNLLNRLARQVLVAGEAFPLTSPCGSNCSYSIEFEGPYVECNDSAPTTLTANVTDLYPIFYGSWNSPPVGSQFAHSASNYTTARFNTSTLTPISVDNKPVVPVLTAQQNNISCIPGRAKYTIKNRYDSNVYSRNVTREPIDKLINLASSLTHDGIVIVPGFTQNDTFAYGTEPANWSTHALEYYRDENMMAICDGMMSWLQGYFQATLATVDQASLANAQGALPLLAEWAEQLLTSVTGVTTSLAVPDGNKTIIDTTRFNRNFGLFSASNTVSTPQFNITEDIINSYLLNITTSIMTAYGRWNTTANATISTAVNVYDFTQPLNLIIPYFLTLALSIPFLVLGTLSLMKNGVSAMDGGFVQIITTSTGSAVLDKAAAGGCLGGNESVPQELKDLKVRFGEIIGRDEPGRIRRAGFGVDSEITDLKKGYSYGVARWI